MTDQSEASAIWSALEPKLRTMIKEMTDSCVRRKKMVVTKAPNGSTIGVQEAYGNTIFIPYLSTLSGVAVGQSVWVDYSYSLANAVAVLRGSGKD